MRRFYMSTLVLDTFELIKELKDAGMNERQAQAQLHVTQVVCQTAMLQLHEEIDAKQFATLLDLKEVELHLTTKIDDVRMEVEKLRGEIQGVRGEIEKVKNNLLLWVLGMLFAQTSLIFGFFGKELGIF